MNQGLLYNEPAGAKKHPGVFNSGSLLADRRFFTNAIEYIFFSNYFYGFCAVGLSIEATVQQKFSLNGLIYFFMVFISTVLYYAYPYIRKSVTSTNPRTNWYTRNYNLMRWNQALITIILLIATVLFFICNGKLLFSIGATAWILIFIFPVVAAFYYGIDPISGKYNLRRIGWLKPFIIGFTWAGLVTIYPVLFYHIINGIRYKLQLIALLLFVKNFMFIAVLCIMFDCKDYASDYCCRVKTFVVQLGLRKTIFYLLVPLSAMGLSCFICYALLHHFHAIKLLLNSIPFILMIMVAYSLRKRRPLLYYLVIIDGLMMVKAVCGIIAMIYF